MSSRLPQLVLGLVDLLSLPRVSLLKETHVQCIVRQGQSSGAQTSAGRLVCRELTSITAAKILHVPMMLGVSLQFPPQPPLSLLWTRGKYERAGEQNSRQEEHLQETAASCLWARQFWQSGRAATAGAAAVLEFLSPTNRFPPSTPVLTVLSTKVKGEEESQDKTGLWDG